MSQEWREVWSRRQLADPAETDLQSLIYLDGFDNPAGLIAAEDWMAYVEQVARVAEIHDGDSVYEVGCGGGAFLMAVKAMADVSVGGCDYAPAMVEQASRAIPTGLFTELEASALPIEPLYDHVMANGVFFYFPSLSYAEVVLRRMIDKARRSVVVLEVPDIQLREAAESFRAEAIGQTEYAVRYQGLDHLYFERGWFGEIADSMGWRSTTFSSLIPGYEQGKFRFGALITPAD